MRALVTGAATGIGRSLVTACIDAGYQVVGVDSDLDSLRALHVGNDAFKPFALDQTDRAQHGEVLGRLTDQPPFDLIIYAGGVSSWGQLQDAAPDELKQVLDLNLRIPMQWTAALLRSRRVVSSATIVFFTSRAKHLRHPSAVFASSLEGVESYARSLSIELAPQGIRTLTVFADPSCIARPIGKCRDDLPNAGRLSSEALAEMVMTAIRKRRSVLVPGWRHRLTLLLSEGR